MEVAREGMWQTVGETVTHVFLPGNLVCEVAMPVSASEATRRYRRGINKIGVNAYQQASQASSPQEAARILENAKQDSLSLNEMANSYQDAYTGGGGGGGGTMG